MAESTVVALPNCSVPSNEPVERVVKILRHALAQAEAGKIVGCALVTVVRDPLAFEHEYHAEQGGRHTLIAGAMSLAWALGRVMNEGD